MEQILKGLAEISRAIMEKSYLEDILALIVSVTAKATGAKICSILLLDKKKGELVLKACQSESGRYSQKTNTPLGKGIAGRVALSNKPVKVMNVQKDPRFMNKKIAREDGLVSLLSIPMSVDGEVIGVINCYTSREYDFSQDEINMLTTVAGQAAIIIRNTELQVMKEVVELELKERIMIEKAKELLMEQRKITGDKAYNLMRKHSMDTRTSIAKIAESIILAASIDLKTPE